MSERSEPKQVCRRNALAFLGYAAAVGLVASSAVLTASQAEAQTTTTPTTPTTPPTDTAKSGTERRQEVRTREQKGGPSSERNVGRPYSAPPPKGYRRAGKSRQRIQPPGTPLRLHLCCGPGGDPTPVMDDLRLTAGPALMGDPKFVCTQ